MAVVRRPGVGRGGGAGWLQVSAALLIGGVVLMLALLRHGPGLVQGDAVSSVQGAAKPAAEPCVKAAGSSAATQQQAAGIAGAGKLWPGTMPMEHPSKATFDRLQADPGLAERDPAVVAEFAATPWLLPPRTKALDYAGVHDLDRLLELRSKPVGKQPKTITLLTFNKRFAVMAQNGIYSMVKFGGVRNHLIVTWDQEDLEACADLNLPCADVARFLPEPMDKGLNAGQYGTHDYLVVCWLRPALLVHLLKQGYATLSTDSDIVFMAKPLWESYLAFMEAGSADAAFQAEGPINGGNYLMLPTPAALSLAAAWSSLAPKMIEQKQHDQQAFASTDRATWEVCQTVERCLATREAVSKENATAVKAVVRTFLPNFFNYWDDLCTLAGGTRIPQIDPCDWAVMLLHPICTGYDGKLTIFRHEGFWFVDDENCRPLSSPAATNVTMCWPLQWRAPGTEVPLYSCPEYGLGLVHERRASRAAAPAAQGAGAAAAQQQLEAQAAAG